MTVIPSSDSLLNIASMIYCTDKLHDSEFVIKFILLIENKRNPTGIVSENTAIVKSRRKEILTRRCQMPKTENIENVLSE